MSKMTETTSPQFSSYNPFDSDSESEQKSKTRRASLAHHHMPPFSSANPFDSDSESKLHCKPSRAFSAPVVRGSRGFENQTFQELEEYAVHKAEETTQKFHGCLKIAEEMRENASRTLVKLHQQGEQITRTHLAAANIEPDLSKAEKLLGTLGGLFSKTWKPTKARDIKGPILTRDDQFTRRANHVEQRQRLGLSTNHFKSRSNIEHCHSEPKSALEKVKVEKAKQEDALSELSSLLGELKCMALDMGGEIERQSKALEPLGDDVEELNSRVRRANNRGRRLLGK